jgi:DNA-binding NtrC family response regulator
MVKMSRPLKTLIVKTKPTKTQFFQPVLSAETNNFQLFFANNLEEALDCLPQNNCDFLLELTLPDSKCLETLLKTKAVAPDVPVIVMADRREKDIAVETLRDGDQDYFSNGKTRKKIGKIISPLPICRQNY